MCDLVVTEEINVENSKDMSVEAPHQQKQTHEPDTLTPAQREWNEHQEAQWAKHAADTASEKTDEDKSFLGNIFNEEVVPTSEALHVGPEEEKGPSRLSRIKASLGAVAAKITDVFCGMHKPGIPQSPQDFKLPKTSTEAAPQKPETEKQPRFDLVDIKARALEIVDRTKYTLGLAKEIGTEVKDILVEKAKDKFDVAKEKTLDVKGKAIDKAKGNFDSAVDKALDIKDAAVVAKHTVMEKAGRAKEVAIGLAGYAVTEGFEFLGMLIAKSAELAKDAPNRLSERFTELAPTPSNPNNRELNRRGKVLVLGLGITAFAGLTYLGRMVGHDGSHGVDIANQMPLDAPGIDGLDMNHVTLPDSQLDQLPIGSDSLPLDQIPDHTAVGPAHEDLTVHFSPEIGTLQEGDTIWDDSMQMLKEGGFNGSESDLMDRTNLLTEWRLKEMGITAEQAKYLPVDTELPMPSFADMQEIIAKTE